MIFIEAKINHTDTNRNYTSLIIQNIFSGIKYFIEPIPLHCLKNQLWHNRKTTVKEFYLH